MIKTDKLISIIFVSYKTKDLLKTCIDSVKNKTADVNYEIIVVDNNSDDGSVEMIKNHFPEIILIESKNNLGFAGGNNLGFAKASGDFILLLNPDAVLTENVIGKAFSILNSNSSIGILGGKILDMNGQENLAARRFPSVIRLALMRTGISKKLKLENSLLGMDYKKEKMKDVTEVDWVSGAFLMMRKKVLDQQKKMDDRYFLYYEEVDFCRQAKKNGWKVIFSPEIFILHVGGGSSKKTGKKMSASGAQLLDIRINSEIKYFLKNKGMFSAAVLLTFEYLHYGIKYIKNKLVSGDDSNGKVNDSLVILKCLNQNVSLLIGR